MIKILSAVALAAILPMSAIAQDAAAPTTSPAPAITSQIAPATAPEQGKIIMFRPSAIMGMGLACPIRYKGVELVELGRGKFAQWSVPAGSYILGNKTASIEINVTAGQTKYVRCQIKPGFMTGRADLQIVDAESYAQHSADYEEKPIVAPTTLAAAQ